MQELGLHINSELLQLEIDEASFADPDMESFFDPEIHLAVPTRATQSEWKPFYRCTISSEQRVNWS
jgi:hypothetical protein